MAGVGECGRRTSLTAAFSGGDGEGESGRVSVVQFV